jgi:hypothetical protein
LGKKIPFGYLRTRRMSFEYLDELKFIQATALEYESGPDEFFW